jgi:hypothetical protein
MFEAFKRRPSHFVARRLVALAEAHGVQKQEIPRLLKGIGYADLEDPARMMAAITPGIVDKAAELFGVRREYLEGIDALAYFPFGSGRASVETSTRQLVNAVVEAASRSALGVRGPLAALTTASVLDRHAARQQWLTPVIVVPSGVCLDGPVYRCRVFGGYFDWLDDKQRIGLKAVVWLVSHHLSNVVPLYQVDESELIGVLSGETVPSRVFTQPTVTDPSLEDYISAPQSSAAAKDWEELPRVQAFLESSGLHEYWWEAVARAAEPPAPEATEKSAVTATSAVPLEASNTCPVRASKREAAEAIRKELQAAARVIWEVDPSATITAVVQQLKAMRHLAGASRSESAIHKAIRSVAPDGANKPGRRPKKST